MEVRLCFPHLVGCELLIYLCGFERILKPLGVWISFKLLKHEAAFRSVSSFYAKTRGEERFIRPHINGCVVLFYKPYFIWHSMNCWC